MSKMRNWHFPIAAVLSLILALCLWYWAIERTTHRKELQFNHNSIQQALRHMGKLELKKDTLFFAERNFLNVKAAMQSRVEKYAVDAKLKLEKLEIVSSGSGLISGSVSISGEETPLSQFLISLESGTPVIAVQALEIVKNDSSQIKAKIRVSAFFEEAQ